MMIYHIKEKETQVRKGELRMNEEGGGLSGCRGASEGDSIETRTTVYKQTLT